MYLGFIYLMTEFKTNSFFSTYNQRKKVYCFRFEFQTYNFFFLNFGHNVSILKKKKNFLNYFLNFKESNRNIVLKIFFH